MRIARVSLSPSMENVVYAAVDDSSARLYSAAPWRGGAPTGEVVKLDTVQLLAPVEPSKIVCIGRNYAAHAKELGSDVPKEPLLFLKPPSALLATGGTIVLPRESSRVEHEAELGVVIGARAKNVPRERALAHVLGYTCVGDITARDLQRSDGQWSRAKGFDTFCPVGPWIETELDPASLRISCRVNGATRQDGPTSDMIFPVPEIVAYVSRMMTLEPGDLIATGTPEGVGPLAPGDTIEIDVSGIGRLACQVRAAS